MEISNKLKINEYVSISQLKRKLKAHLVDQGYSEFKTSVFAQGLIVSLVMVLEEIVLDCLKNVTKDKSGLYTINTLILKSILYESEKYSFCLKYLRKYNLSIKYHDSVLFNIKKVMNNLETKHGSKLMIDSESNNMICYIILGLQYDMIELSLKMVKYANRKTLNNRVLEIVCQYLMSDDFSSKIKLKLDSFNITNDDGNEDNDDGNEDNDDGNEDNDDGNEDNDNGNEDNDDGNEDNEEENDKIKIIETKEVKEVKEVKEEVKDNVNIDKKKNKSKEVSKDLKENIKELKEENKNVKIEKEIGIDDKKSVKKLKINKNQ